MRVAMHPKNAVHVGGADRALRKALFDFLTDKAGWKRKDNHEAFAAFNELVNNGCDGVFLASMLEILAEAHHVDTWQGLTGFSDPDSLRTALKRLRVCAGDVEKLLGGVIGKALLQKPSERALPSSLRDVADRFERAVRANKPAGNLTKRAALGAIVRHVKDRTGTPRDELVARVVSPALGPRDAVAQRQWRKDNAGLISAVRAT